MRSLLLLFLSIMLPVISSASGESSTGESLDLNFYACSKKPMVMRHIRRKYDQLAYLSTPRLGEYNRHTDEFISALKNGCSSFLTKQQLSEYIALAERLQKQKALLYSKQVLKEIIRVSKFGLDISSIEQLESIRKSFNFEFSEIDPEGLLRHAITRGMQRQEQRAESCTSVDLRNDHEPFQTTRHQGETGWCFAYSAADLVTHHYQKNNPGLEHRFSAVGMTVDYYYNDIFSSTFESLTRGREMPRNLSGVHFGHMEAIFSRTLPTRGLCPESEVNGSKNILSHIRTIESIEDLRRRAHGNDEISEDDGEDLADEVMECASCALALNSVFPNLDMNNLVQVLRKVEDHSYMTRLTNLQCEGHRINSGIPTREQIRTSRSFRESSSEMDRVLDSNSPVFLAYHSTVIRKGQLLRSHDFAGKGDGHASLIIGRRFNIKTNKCEYLVRNSYGSSCANYHSSLSCSNGQFWLAEETMETAFMGALWINER